MKTHIKIVAVLHIAAGVLGLLAAGILFAVFGTVTGLVAWNEEPGAATIVGIVAMAIIGLVMVLSIPDIVAGWGLLSGRSWARVLMLILGALHLFNFPFGTALGIYTLWAILRPEQPQLAGSAPHAA